MANVLIVRESPKYLVKSVSDHLKTHDHTVVEVDADIKSLSKIKEKYNAALLFVDPDLIENQHAIIYLRDLTVELEIPLYLLGFPEDVEKVKKLMPGEVIQGEFFRPFDVKDIATKIDDFVINEGSQIKKKILVVDDSGMMLRNVKGLLGDKYQVVLANSGAMAIKFISMDQPDLVLLDYEMPIVNGKQVLEMIRSETEFSSIPVIFLTGKNDRETIIDVMSLKPQGYLLKTMKAEDFIQSIDDFFEKRKRI